MHPVKSRWAVLILFVPSVTFRMPTLARDHYILSLPCPKSSWFEGNSEDYVYETVWGLVRSLYDARPKHPMFDTAAVGDLYSVLELLQESCFTELATYCPFPHPTLRFSLISFIICLLEILHEFSLELSIGPVDKKRTFRSWCSPDTRRNSTQFCSAVTRKHLTTCAGRRKSWSC
jgi:hypothetical protein